LISSPATATKALEEQRITQIPERDNDMWVVGKLEVSTSCAISIRNNEHTVKCFEMLKLILISRKLARIIPSVEKVRIRKLLAPLADIFVKLVIDDDDNFLGHHHTFDV